MKRRFARFYYDQFIEEYPDVYDDVGAFSAWMHLLVVSEKAWPAQPELPRSVKERDLDVLVAAGLVALGPRFTFALRGHDAERKRRNAVAMAGANASADARANAERTPSIEKTETENKKRFTPSPLRGGTRKNGTNPRATATSPRQNGSSPRQIREAQKRGPSALHEILTSIQTKGADHDR